MLKNLRNRAYWFVVQQKNNLNRFLHYSRCYNQFRSLYINRSAYWRPLLDALRYKLLGSKIITCFILDPLHLLWIEDVLSNVTTEQSSLIQIFHTNSTPQSAGGLQAVKYYSMKGLRPTLGQYEFIPTIVSDLYITPTSASARIFPLTCPKVVFMHSLIGIHGIYEEDAFDEYDYVYCAGPHHISDFKQHFLQRGVGGKCLIPGGYPRLDEQLRRNSQLEQEEVSRTVIIAPSLVSSTTREASIMPYAEQIVELLLADGWHIIFRPHPFNMTPSNAFTTECHDVVRKFQNCEAFLLDESKDYHSSYRSAAVMVSDVSGTAYTFAFGFEKPVLFFEPSKEITLGKGLLYQNRRMLGAATHSVDQVVPALNNIFGDRSLIQRSIVDCRKKSVFNVGRSAQYFAENISYVLDKKQHPEWVYV